jgi:dolichyl-phosphate-mannose--protein O-mannosyl transferase
METLRLLIVSWVVGLITYVVCCAFFYGQLVPITSGDFRSVALCSVVAFAVAFYLAYLPALLALRRLLHGVHPAWPFPVLAIVLGSLPTAMISFFWGGNVRSLFSSEATLFYSMFATVGLMIGIGFVRMCRNDQRA